MRTARLISGVSGHLLEIAIFIAVVIADAYGLVPLTQTIILVPFVWIALRLRNEAWKISPSAGGAMILLAGFGHRSLRNAT